MVDLHNIVVMSGGQTGVDRAALDFAMHHELECKGWCPAERWAEDGSIPEKYPLKETPSKDPGVRTEWNVRDSDGTLILHEGWLDKGSAYTISMCMRLNKAIIEIDLSGQYDTQKVRDWINKHNISKLNIAGPRQSKSSNAYEEAYMFLVRLFGL